MFGSSPETSLVPTGAVTGVSLRDVVFVLFRRRLIILAIALPIILVGGLSLFQQTGSYTAVARVVVELVKVDLPRWNISSRIVDYDRELSTFSNIAMSLPVAEMAANSLRDSIPVMIDLDPNLIGLEQGANLRDFLTSGLDVGVQGESSILEFRFTSANPRISLMATGALRDAFVHYQIHGRKSLKAVAFYEEQLAVVRVEIDSLLAVRREVLNEYGYSSLTDELRYDSGQLSDLEGKLNQASSVRKALETEYDRLSIYLQGDPREFPMGPDESRSHTLVQWRNLVAQHEDRLSQLLTVHTEDSGTVERQRELIASSLNSLAREEANYVKGLEISLLSARQNEMTLLDQISELRLKNKRAPEAYQKVSLLDSEIESLRGLLEDIQGKRGEVRLSQLADERVSSVVSLTDPELATVISGSKTIVYFAFIVVIALALAIVIAFILESLDHRVYAPRDVEEHLKLPVFASVSRTD